NQPVKFYLACIIYKGNSGRGFVSAQYSHPPPSTSHLSPLTPHPSPLTFHLYIVLVVSGWPSYNPWKPSVMICSPAFSPDFTSTLSPYSWPTPTGFFRAIHLSFSFTATITNFPLSSFCRVFTGMVITSLAV